MSLLKLVIFIRFLMGRKIMPIPDQQTPYRIPHTLISICASIFTNDWLSCRWSASTGDKHDTYRIWVTAQLSRWVIQMTNRDIFIHGALNKIFEETLNVITGNKVFAASQKDAPLMNQHHLTFWWYGFFWLNEQIILDFPFTV